MKRMIILSLLLLLGCKSGETTLDSDHLDDITVELIQENKNCLLKTTYHDWDYTIDITELKPWKVDLCYIDGVLSVALGVKVKSPLDPIEEKRPFIYNLNPIKGRLKPRLRISRLYNPMEDFQMVKLDDDTSYNLMSIEKTKEDLYTLNLYEIRNYGGELIYSSPGTKSKPPLDINEIINNL